MLSSVKKGLQTFGNNMARLEWIERLLFAGYKVPVLCHPSVIIYLGSQIGLGSTIEPFVVINYTIPIGVGAINGAHTVIEHEVVISNDCNIRAGAVLALRTRIFDDADKVMCRFLTVYNIYIN